MGHAWASLTVTLRIRVTPRINDFCEEANDPSKLLEQ